MEEYGFAILMLIFGGALLFYALLMGIFKKKEFIPYRRRYAAKMDDEKEYMTKLAKILALVALAPIIGGLSALILPEWASAIIMVALFAILITIGAKTTKING